MESAKVMRASLSGLYKPLSAMTVSWVRSPSKKPSRLYRMHGASRRSRVMREITSAISSRVPVPPGNAMNASPLSIIISLRSVRSSVATSSVRSSNCGSRSMKKFGSTPITSPPAADVLSASIPMSPDLDPPYTSL